FHFTHQTGALEQALSQERMLQVGEGLGGTLDRVVLRGRAVPEAVKLGENEPDPVARLAASPEFLDDIAVDVLLRREETRQMKGVVGCHGVGPGRSISLPIVVSGEERKDNRQKIAPALRQSSGSSLQLLR